MVRSFLVAICLIAVFGVAGAVVALNDRTYEAAATWDATARDFFYVPDARTPDCVGPGCSVEGVTYPLDTLVRLHRATAAYVLGLATAPPPSPTRGSFYGEPERSYLTRVRDVLRAALVAAGIALLLAVALVATARRRARTLGAAAFATLVLAAIALVIAVAAPDVATSAVYGWLRGGAAAFTDRSNLHELYPPSYGRDLATWTASIWAGLSLVLLVIAVVAERLRRS